MSIDIVERTMAAVHPSCLRKPDVRCGECADRIAAAETIAALRAENEELRAALAQSVPLSAIEAALDGLQRSRVSGFDQFEIAEVRRALLGPSENGDTDEA